jgi:hypothetical protein
MLPPGEYRTEKGSTMTITGPFGGISVVSFDWVEEEPACVDCVPEPYDDDGYLVWTCNVCDGGRAKLTRTEPYPTKPDPPEVT